MVAAEMRRYLNVSSQTFTRYLTAMKSAIAAGELPALTAHGRGYEYDADHVRWLIAHRDTLRRHQTEPARAAASVAAVQRIPDPSTAVPPVHADIVPRGDAGGDPNPGGDHERATEKPRGGLLRRLFLGR